MKVSGVDLLVHLAEVAAVVVDARAARKAFKLRSSQVGAGSSLLWWADGATYAAAAWGFLLTMTGRGPPTPEEIGDAVAARIAKA